LWLTYATDDVYADYIGRVIAGQLFCCEIWRCQLAVGVEVMSPALMVGGAGRKIRLSLLSVFIVLRYVYPDMAVRVEAAGGAA